MDHTHRRARNIKSKELFMNKPWWALFHLRFGLLVMTKTLIPWRAGIQRRTKPQISGVLGGHPSATVQSCNYSTAGARQRLRSYSRYQLGRRPDQAGSLLTKQVQLQKLRRFRKAYSDLNAGLAYFPAPTTPTPLSIIGTAALMRSISAASFSTAANASRSKPWCS